MSRPDTVAIVDATLSVAQARFGGVEAIYIFGSLARDGLRDDSDLDIAVLATAPIEPLARFEAQRDLSLAFGRDVDLIDLRSAGTVLRHEIVTTGSVLHARSRDHTLDFEARVLSDYQTFMDSTRELREAIRSDGIVHAQ